MLVLEGGGFGGKGLEDIQPVYDFVVSHFENEFIDHTVDADCSAD